MPLLHIYSDLVHRLVLVVAERVSRSRDDFKVLLGDARLCAQDLEQVGVALGGHLGENLHHIVLVDFGGMFLDVSLEFRILVLDFFDGSVVEFVQFRLVVFLFVEVNLELLDFVFLSRLSRIVLLRENQHEVLVFLDHFRHLDSLGVLFAGERFCVCVN